MALDFDFSFWQHPLIPADQLIPALGWEAWFVWGVVAIYGACIGSFLNVVALRQLKDEEFVKKPSYCFHCHTPLKWYHNIPIFSWLLLGGKCGYCGASLSVQYPLIELASLLLALLTVGLFGIGWHTLFLFFLVGCAVVMLITDVREKLIFVQNSLWLIPAGLLMHALGVLPTEVTWLAWQAPWAATGLHDFFNASFYSALAGVLGVFIVFEGLILLTRLLVGQDGFGHGDTLILMGFAAYLGWEWTLLTLVLGMALQCIVYLPIMIGQWCRQHQWTLLAWFGGAILAGVLPSVGYYTQLLSPTVFTLTSFIALPLSVFGLFKFVHLSKQGGTLTAVPFGPALIVAGLGCLFFGNSHLRWWLLELKNLLGY
ncbi:MAG: prepilin peptidase [Vampirovibrionales bacterium]